MSEAAWGTRLEPEAQAPSASRATAAGASRSHRRLPIELRRKISPCDGCAVRAGVHRDVPARSGVLLTAGENEERILTSNKLPSPAETFERRSMTCGSTDALSRNTLVSLRRVALGFALAVVVGVPLGVLCGCFPMVECVLAPVVIFGRNIPIAALIPLTFAFFGIGEAQKDDVHLHRLRGVHRCRHGPGDQRRQRAVHRHGLHARRKPRQAIIKVLVPLAMPSVFNSLRLLFGLAFGYIMLAEIDHHERSAGGLGSIIQRAQRLGQTGIHHPGAADHSASSRWSIDRCCSGCSGSCSRTDTAAAACCASSCAELAHGWEDLKGLVVAPRSYADAISSVQPVADTKSSDKNR